MSDEQFNRKARQAMLDALMELGPVTEEAIQLLHVLLNDDRIENYNAIRRKVGYLHDLWNALQKPLATLLEEDAAQEVDQ